MADNIVINEVLCFIKSHFGSVPSDSIRTVISTFFTDDELTKAKAVVHDICVKNLLERSVPSIIARKGDNKKKSDAEDIVAYFTLLDESAFSDVTYVAQNLHRIPVMDPSAIDICFLLETVEDMKKKIEALSDISKQVANLNTAVNNLTIRQGNRSTESFSRDVPSQQQRVPGVLQQQNISDASYAAVASAVTKAQNATGMAKDVNLQVALPVMSQHQSAPVRSFNRKPVVVGSKHVDNTKLKASAKPRELHIYLGNLDNDTTADDIRDYVQANTISVRILACDIVHSSRFEETRSCSAHVTVNFLDKDKALSPDSWPDGSTVRQWRQRRTNRNLGWG